MGTSSDLGGLLDALDQPVLVVTDQVFAYVNDAAAAFLGASREEIVGSRVDDWLSGSVSAAALQRLDRSGAVVEFRRRDDDVVALRLETPKPVSFEGSGALMIVGQRGKAKSADVLERLIVVNRLTTLGALVAGIGRELQTYLVAVGDNLDDLVAQVRSQLAPDASESMAELLDSTVFGAEQLRHLATDVGSLASDGAEVQLVDLAELVRTSLRLVRADVERRARLVERYLPGLPPVWANPARLSQVVLNLVLNAVRALPEDCTAESNSIVIEVGTDGTGDPLLAISDTGTGLPPEALEALTRNRPPGASQPLPESGLGLYLSREIVHELGGEIDLDTEKGRGTTMFITLPAADLSGRSVPRVH